MNVEVGPLPRRRVRAASRLLTAAFADDGILSRFLPGRRGQVAIPAFFAAILDEHLQTTYAASAGRELVGVAAWAPPDAQPTSFAARLRPRSRLLLVRALFPQSSQQLFAGFRELERLHPSEEHWYLAFAGVDPSRQGEGIGDSLLRPVLAQADRDGVFCYLETPFPRTHAFYRRLGFEIISTEQPFVDARPLDIMIREPRPLDAQTQWSSARSTS
jgi:ribosomal protein S18 acetylase RimI-like enzyme